MATARFSGAKYVLAMRMMSSAVTASYNAGSVLMVPQSRQAARTRSSSIKPKLNRRLRKLRAAFWFLTFCSSRSVTGSV